MFIIAALVYRLQYFFLRVFFVTDNLDNEIKFESDAIDGDNERGQNGSSKEQSEPPLAKNTKNDIGDETKARTSENEEKNTEVEEFVFIEENEIVVDVTDIKKERVEKGEETDSGNSEKAGSEGNLSEGFESTDISEEKNEDKTPPKRHLSEHDDPLGENETKKEILAEEFADNPEEIEAYVDNVKIDYEVTEIESLNQSPESDTDSAMFDSCK